MALRIAAERTFNTTATFVDGQTAAVTFRVLPDDELTSLPEDGGRSALRATLVRVEVEDQDGNPAEFTPEIREQLLGSAPDVLALQRAYNQAVITGKLGN
ncbi:hypothetical protein [Sagittula sp. S175]|uniref:hypothetical protein n=1 Tax=Sagittula sp. S175 TaxID=3415129 RepID=UPI003C7B0B9B